MACNFTLGQRKKFRASIEGMALLLIFSIDLILAAVLSIMKLPTGEDRGWLGFMLVVDSYCYRSLTVIMETAGMGW